MPRFKKENILLYFPLEYDLTPTINNEVFYRLDATINLSVQAARCGLLTFKINKNFNNLSSFTISWDMQYEKITVRDWNHIFSFGTHYCYNGDNPFFPISCVNSRNNIEAIYNYSLQEISTLVGFHNHTIIYSNNEIAYFLDYKLKSKINGSPNTPYFYFNGAGSTYR